MTTYVIKHEYYMAPLATFSTEEDAKVHMELFRDPAMGKINIMRNKYGDGWVVWQYCILLKSVPGEVSA